MHILYIKDIFIFHCHWWIVHYFFLFFYQELDVVETLAYVKNKDLENVLANRLQKNTVYSKSSKTIRHFYKKGIL